ncbi:hypothetical protein MMU07_18905 [Aquiflexum sp. LQ15W]|uniref:DUF6913 domain-containing protein n=1 Tax=Cognataquiflexum nitidum TaxID=2922272 RepID=UPI001F12DC64|nr:hypothetical protein [Cognataquiflexum nitidum]MCH6201658.1 hypothetical protein [Cognataquiflexum nitidum]
MNYIKKWMIAYQLDKSLKNKNKTEVEFPTNPRRVAILASNKEEFLESKEILRKIWGFNIRIIGGYFSEENTDAEAICPIYFSMWGLPTDYFNEFMEENLDFILIPTLHLSPYLRYLLLANKSKFKMGFYSKENSPLLDFMIKKEGEDLTPNLEKLMAYFKKIKETC